MLWNRIRGKLLKKSMFNCKALLFKGRLLETLISRIHVKGKLGQTICNLLTVKYVMCLLFFFS